MVNELLVVTTSVAGVLHNTVTNNHNITSATNYHDNDIISNNNKSSVTARNLNNNINNNFNNYINNTTDAVRLAPPPPPTTTTTTISEGRDIAASSLEHKQTQRVNTISANQMSSEPIKIELDCALNAYSTRATTTTTTTAANGHHHTHHHHHHHHHIHFQSNENCDDELIVDEDDDDDELITDDDDEAEGDEDDEQQVGDDDQDQVGDDVEQASDDSGSGTSSSVESSTSGTSSAAGCSEISTSSLANAYSTTTKLTNSTLSGTDFGNTNCLEDNGGAHNSNVSIQCANQVEKLSLSHTEHEDNSGFSERYHNSKRQDVNLISSEGSGNIVSSNDCNGDLVDPIKHHHHQQQEQHQQLDQKHGYNLQPTCYQTMHSSNSTSYHTLDDSIVIGAGETIASLQMSHMVAGNENSVSLCDKPSNLIDNHEEQIDEEGEESSEDNDEQEEVDDDDEDYVYEDVEDGDVEEEEEDDDEEDDDDDDENGDEDYVIASQDNVGDNCPGDDDEDVDEDDDTDGIENSNDQDDDDEDDDDDDDSIDNTMNPLLHPDNTSLSLDGERMLEVTRKLVRSTERDPDRDLRKQVLLKTAIKKLPHFMEYNRYSESMNHSLHLNGGSAPPINCLSPTQAAYYEHHHHHHHHHHHNHHHLLNQPHSNQEGHLQLDSQQKSFYYSVQPNAIQMSTTGLRMLDLNDDHESEAGSNESKDLQGYSNNRTSLENTQSHDYEASLISQQSSESQTNLYDRYSQQSQTTHKQTHPSDFMTDPLQQHKDTCSRDYDMGHQDITADQLVGDNQSDNLYTSNENSDIGAAIKTDERIPIAFQVACDVCDFNCVPGNCGKKLHVQDSTSMDSITNLSTQISMQNNVLEEHQHDFGAQLEDDSETKDTLLSSQAINNDSGISNYGEDPMDEVDGVNRNGSNTSSSSQDSSNDSNDSINLNHSIPQSFLETVDTENPLIDNRLNTSPEIISSAHDSGVSLFSPRSNKRSSSSIGLDDEMEIDNLTELSSAQNSSIGSNISQYKKLRKRENID